ncbi:MAG: hypothetical protein ACJ0BI_01985 [Paracoccaceae bacterium]
MHSKEEAYKLSSPGDHKKYYDKWSGKYDEEFVESDNYKYPEKISKLFMNLAELKNSPTADIGCVTFTFGHLGPEYVVRVIQMLHEGGLGVIGIKKSHYLSKSFD